MTPQLMQAIKLLQLSNLDLVGLRRRRARKEPPAGTRRRRRAGGADAGTGEVGAGRRQRANGRRRRRGDWHRSKNLETSRSAIEDRLGTDLENVFPEDCRPDRAARRPSNRRRPIPNGPAPAAAAARTATTISKRSFRQTTTLADHLAEQLALAIADPVRRMIGQYLIDMVDEAGYLIGDLVVGGRTARRLDGGGRGGAWHSAGLRSAGRVRAQPHRMSGDPAQGARPLRSGDAGAGRASRSACQARSRRVAPDLRRRRRGPHRDDRGNPHGSIRSPASLSARPWCSRSCPTCSCGPGPDGGLSSSSIPTRCRRCWSISAITPNSVKIHQPTIAPNPISRKICSRRPG